MQDAYFALYSRVYAVLLDDYDADDAAASIADDWSNDSKGRDTLSNQAYGDSLFELADMWVHAIKEDDCAHALVWSLGLFLMPILARTQTCTPSLHLSQRLPIHHLTGYSPPLLCLTNTSHIPPHAASLPPLDLCTLPSHVSDHYHPTSHNASHPHTHRRCLPMGPLPPRHHPLNHPLTHPRAPSTAGRVEEDGGVHIRPRDRPG